ncbi:MAG: prolipoprotein diacylglyceryl transferase [Anaerolineales bacterium]|nr:prolipoprotein diacylglyceryl transferase [Anaerolineales bacterium]
MPGFEIGPFSIRYYGIILMLGALAGAWLAARESSRRGQDSEIVWDGLIWVLIGGIIGARIWHILTPPPSNVEMGITTAWYLTHPLDALSIWKGGLGIPGAVIGGVLALYLFTRKYKLNFLFWTDCAAPGLALGQAIGRWGNYINQELYGAPTDLPWAVHIDPAHRLPGYQEQETYHPLFLYESLWSLANMALLLWLVRRYPQRLRDGDIFLVYLIVYPVGRFLLEFIRLDASMVAGINANQTFMLVVALAAAGLLAWRHSRPEAEPKAVAPRPALFDETHQVIEVEHIHPRIEDTDDDSESSSNSNDDSGETLESGNT